MRTCGGLTAYCSIVHNCEWNRSYPHYGSERRGWRGDSSVSATRANFLLATTAATLAKQRCRSLPLDSGAATHPQRQQARLSAVSSYFLRISIFPFIYFLTSRADLKPACGGKKSRQIIRPRTFSGAVSSFLEFFWFILFFIQLSRRLAIHSNRRSVKQ